MRSLNYIVQTAGPPGLIETFHRRNIIIGGLSISEEPGIGTIRIAVLLRQNGQEMGRYATGYAHPYSLRLIRQRGVIVNGIQLEKRMPGPDETSYEAIVISLS